MMAGDRLPMLTFGVSLLLHLLLVVVSMQQWTWWQPRPEAPQKTRYVVRLQRPAPMLTPAVTPMPLVTPAPVVPTPVAPTVQPQVPKPVERMQIEPEPAHTPKMPSKTVKPRRPTKPKKRVVKSELAPRTKRQADPQPIPSVPPPVAAVEPSQQPSSSRNEAALSPPQSADAARDALEAYLNLIVETLERHKRYPKDARRQAISGRVVLQFVVRPDGRVVNPQIADSDGHKSFHQAALQALSRVGQMPPFPTGLQRSQLLVEVPISYQIKKR
jgi:protein TonB